MKTFTLAILITTFFACKTKPVNLNNYNGEVLTIGSGGGFTGVSTTYYITEDGSVFRNGLSDTSYISVGSLDKKVIKQQFDAYKKMGFVELDHNNPGNRYYYMKLGEGKKLQWGGGDKEIQNLPIYHRNIMQLIKQLDSEK